MELKFASLDEMLAHWIKDIKQVVPIDPVQHLKDALANFGHVIMPMAAPAPASAPPPSTPSPEPSPRMKPSDATASGMATAAALIAAKSKSKP